MIQRLGVLVLVIALSPLFLMISALIIIFSGKPIFFVQERTGKDGKPFRIYKFRSMRVGADKEQDSLRSQNEADGPAFKIYNDPRLTSIGRVLFHTGLDELPQLINVIKGEMEIVGPRPLPLNEAEKIDKKYQERNLVKPGIISPWIMNGYHKMSFEEWMESDLEYIKNKSSLGDLWLILRGSLFLLKLVAKELFDILTVDFKNG